MSNMTLPSKILSPLRQCDLDFMPDLHGKTIVIKGANSGIGYECAGFFAHAGARIVMACRNAAKANEAIKKIRAKIPEALVEFWELDLGSLVSIRAFADQVATRLERIDILCNNAGVFSSDKRIRKTQDGFELHFGINHLGHFALTGLLLNKMKASVSERIVTVSSMGRDESKPGIDFADLQCIRSYSPLRAYSNSKLANLFFSFELDRRIRTNGFGVKAIACTPGLTYSNLGRANVPRLVKMLTRLPVQSTAQGALSEVHAAIGEDIDGGDYIGRGGFMARFGKIAKLNPSSMACDPEAAKRLWAASEEMTEVKFLQ